MGIFGNDLDDIKDMEYIAMSTWPVMWVTNSTEPSIISTEPQNEIINILNRIDKRLGELTELIKNYIEENK